MYPDFSKIDNAISFGGPGYSDEYLRMHSDGIKKSAGKLTHYKWGFVGDLLTQPDGVNDRLIKFHDDESATREILGIDYKKLWRHSPVNTELRNGYVQDEDPGNKCDLMDPFGDFSRVADNGLDILIIVAMAGITELIPVVGPILSPIITSILSGVVVAHRVSSLISSSVDNINRTIADIKEAWNNFTHDFYQRYLAPQVSGEFSINKQGFVQMVEEIDSIRREIGDISEDIEAIQKSLKYDSISGTYYKSKLWCVNNSLRWDSDKLVKFREAADNIARIYNDTDSQVAELFS